MTTLSPIYLFLHPHSKYIYCGLKIEPQSCFWMQVTMASQNLSFFIVIAAVGIFSVGKAQSDLPIVKEADCEEIPLINFKKCLIIEFKNDAPVVEYAGLDTPEDKFPNILIVQDLTTFFEVFKRSSVHHLL